MWAAPWTTPPDPDAVTPTPQPPAFVTIKSTGKCKITEVQTLDADIVDISCRFGVWHALTKRSLWRGSAASMRLVGSTQAPANKFAQSRVVGVSNTRTAQAVWDGYARGSVALLDEIVTGRGIFSRFGCIYTAGANEKLIQIRPMESGTRVICGVDNLDGLIGRSTQVFDGVVIQAMLGRNQVIVPYDQSCTHSWFPPQLDGYRIVDAKAVWPAVVVVGEKAGKFDRFIFGIKVPGFDTVCYEDRDIAYNGINLTVTAKGVGILLLSYDELCMFQASNPSKQAIVQQPPINSAMRMFSDESGTYFVNGNSIQKLEISV